MKTIFFIIICVFVTVLYLFALIIRSKLESENKINIKMFKLLKDKDFWKLCKRVFKGIFLFPLMLIVSVFLLFISIIDTGYYISFIENLYKNVKEELETLRTTEKACEHLKKFKKENE